MFYWNLITTFMWKIIGTWNLLCKWRGCYHLACKNWQQTRSLNWPQFMQQWFTKFTEFNESSASVRKSSNPFRSNGKECLLRWALVKVTLYLLRVWKWQVPQNLPIICRYGRWFIKIIWTDKSFCKTVLLDTLFATLINGFCQNLSPWRGIEPWSLIFWPSVVTRDIVSFTSPLQGSFRVYIGHQCHSELNVQCLNMGLKASLSHSRREL